MRSIKETSVSHFKNGGHNHDGRNSTKIDFTKYTPDDLKVLADLLQDAQRTLNDGGDAAEIIEGGSQVAGEFIVSQVDAPSTLTLATDVVFDGHERTYIDVEWEAPPVQDFYYDEYYFDYYNPVSIFGSNVSEYAVSLVKEGQPESDHRTITKNTRIRFWDVDPETEYRVYVWSLNSVGAESLYITDTIESNEIKRVYVGQKNRNVTDVGDFETGIDGWTIENTVGTATISSSTTQALSGTKSLRVLWSVSGQVDLISPPIDVVGTTSYDISTSIYQDGVTTVFMYVTWYDEFGTEIVEDAVGSGGVVANRWSKIPISNQHDFYSFVVAPDLAVTAQCRISMTQGNGDANYIDDFKFEQGTTIEGLKWSTDSEDQKPRIFVDGHTAIGAETPNSRIPAYIYFDEAESVWDQGSRRQQVTIYSGASEEGPDALEGDPLGSFFIVRAQSDNTGVQHRDRSDLVFRPAETDTHSLPRGVISYATRATDRTGIGSTEIVIMTGGSWTWLKNRIYEFDFSCGRVFNSNAGDTFAMRFKVGGTTRLSHTLTPNSAFQPLGWRFGGAWVPAVDVTGSLSLTVLRLTGTGTIALEVGNNDMYLTGKDIGASHIADGIDL